MQVRRNLASERHDKVRRGEKLPRGEVNFSALDGETEK